MSATLADVLEESRSLGFLGPGPVVHHIRHAETFLPLLPDSAYVLDLGSGGGLPGLVVAMERDDLTLCLLDANERRTRFLRRSVTSLQLGHRVSVRTGRAEDLARSGDLRHGFDVVMSRSFGSPAITAECAVGFLRGAGSQLLVSEPPEAGLDRWPADGLEELGLRSSRLVAGAAATVRVLEALSPCPDRYPRPVGRPAKRPLF